MTAVLEPSRLWENKITPRRRFNRRVLWNGYVIGFFHFQTASSTCQYLNTAFPGQRCGFFSVKNIFIKKLPFKSDSLVLGHVPLRCLDCALCQGPNAGWRHGRPQVPFHAGLESACHEWVLDWWRNSGNLIQTKKLFCFHKYFLKENFL